VNPACRETASGRGAAAFLAEDRLALAAAPTFAVMALLNAVAAADPAAVICSAAGLSPVQGMLAMYVLMAVFHLHPWLKIARAYRSGWD
jgi:hypothetical protein